MGRKTRFSAGFLPSADWAPADSARRCVLISRGSRFHASAVSFSLAARPTALGHVPIIDPHPRNVPGGKDAIAAEARGRRNAGYALAEDVRYNERSAAERVNGGLKDDFGGRYVRVRGHVKVFCHLMFGVLALAIDHLMRLIT